ncbi:Niemann-Pick C1 protein Flags: Precursor [Monoraphidium neglectum]|uniref:Niemann-Pick C1 protein n=1 Tax=Monoraphidium neglectum TaxID=145388 RepID=A0A0D2MEM6_9CHLO|nr:Niemann-Pick C1 protein Flags: Precursor [Monoraphidium neglectum]KIZ01590.1 Niemann-Pick C1 protein Flags: Precursor [Monoraphidium neglectum]|eukprot:XP_013900609.1 Niemann-Pick C1 protein Flags: Precursor [Monoraphidium neglectum]
MCDQFIGALKAARAFAATASRDLGLEVFPYSVFHVFFEQYLTPVRDAAYMVGLPCLAVTGAAWAFTGSLWASAILLLMLASLLLQLGGAMYLAGIQVNAVSLVNLAMALGIAVEFNAHILHSFCVTPGPRPYRARAALVKMGASVTSGITLTKFVGVVVLAFAKTQIFEVYYFRLYLALVVLGAAHGLVLLPVVLSRFGPPSWSEGKGGGGSTGGGGGGGRGRRGGSGGAPSWREAELESGRGLGGAGASGGAKAQDEAGTALPALAAAGVAAAAVALEEREQHGGAAGAGARAGSGGSFAGGSFSGDELEGMEMADSVLGGDRAGGGD